MGGACSCSRSLDCSAALLFAQAKKPASTVGRTSLGCHANSQLRSFGTHPHPLAQQRNPLIGLLGKLKDAKKTKPSGIYTFPFMKQKENKDTFLGWHANNQLRSFGARPHPLEEERNPLIGLLGKLRDAKKMKPGGPYTFLFQRPKENEAFEFVGSSSFQIGNKKIICELVIDAWPEPELWIIHGLWFGYVRNGWLVSYVRNPRGSNDYKIIKETAKQEIDDLPSETKAKLHKVWRRTTSTSRKEDVDFWAYQKVRHCWDITGYPRGKLFGVVATLGVYVREKLKVWSTKSGFQPNKFYDTEFIMKEVKELLGVKPFLRSGRDDDLGDPRASKLPYVRGLSFSVDRFWDGEENKIKFRLVDHPSAWAVKPGWVYYLG